MVEGEGIVRLWRVVECFIFRVRGVSVVILGIKGWFAVGVEGRKGPIIDASA